MGNWCVPVSGMCTLCMGNIGEGRSEVVFGELRVNKQTFFIYTLLYIYWDYICDAVRTFLLA